MEVDLRWQIGAGVDLFEKIEGGDLGVAEIFLGVGFVDALGEKLRVVRIRPNLLAFLGEDRARAGILAHRENSARGDLGVLQQRVGDVAVVIGRLRVLENSGDLLEVLGAEKKIRVVKGFTREVGERLGCDFEDLATFKVGGADALF